MNLHLENEAFRELIELAADHFGYEQSHVEKDYWVCKILKELALSDFAGRIYFKGGTSLSKTCGIIIDRFSEDLDMFAYSGNPASSKQAEKTLNRNISHFIIENNKEMYYPAQLQQIIPIITEYLLAIEKEELIIRFDLNTFEVQTIDPKRTLCDKISRLTRLSYSDDFEVLIAKYIRDVYDVYRLLRIPEYTEFVQSDEFIEALKRVTDEDGLYRNSQSHNPISKARIYAQTETILHLPPISRAYHEELRKLMFDPNNMPSLNKIINTITLLQKPLKRFDERYRI